MIWDQLCSLPGLILPPELLEVFYCETDGGSIELKSNTNSSNNRLTCQTGTDQKKEGFFPKYLIYLAGIQYIFAVEARL